MFFIITLNLIFYDSKVTPKRSVYIAQVLRIYKYAIICNMSYSISCDVITTKFLSILKPKNDMIYYL